MNRIKKERDEFVVNLYNVKEFIELNKELSGVLESNCFAKSNDDGGVYAGFKERYFSVMNTPVTYNAVIISIYGCFEAYIDKIADVLLDFWSINASSYNQISKSIRDKHLQKCGDFFSNSQRYQNMDITEKNVVKKLNACLVSETQFMLNKELILSHSGNLNITQLMQFFSELGLKDCKNRIIKNMQYVEYFADKFELSNEDARKMINFRNGDDKFLFKELTQLVEQRNKVAHGWSVDERLSKEYLIDSIIPFMKMLGCVIAEIFVNDFAEILYMTSSLKPFDNAIAVYNKRILCINSKNSHLKRNDYIFAYNGKQYITLNILKIQINTHDVEEILEDNIDIGLLVDLEIKKKWRFYYI